MQREDAGHYTLIAKTKTGKISKKDVELVVEDRSSGDDPPQFIRRLTDLSVKVGTRTRLLVEIRSSSSVKVTENKANIKILIIIYPKQLASIYLGNMVSKRSTSL